MLKLYKFQDEELQRIWQAMYAENQYLFPYSAYAYNAIVRHSELFKPKSWFYKNFFYVYFKGQQPALILPLSLKRGVLYLYGDLVSGAGHLDFIYPPTVSDADFAAALAELLELHPQYTLEVHKLNERSRLNAFFKRQADVLGEQYNFEQWVDRECVKIFLPQGNYDAYFAGLTKNAKQNLHKLYNKLRKNKITYFLKVVHEPVQDKDFLDALIRIYVKRQAEITGRPLNRINIRYLHPVIMAIQQLSEHYTFCIYLNDKPAAFMTGFKSNYQEIVFPWVAMDSAQAALVPGKLMINESVRWCLENREREQIAALDLSRGPERYKFEMGGTQHLNYGYSLHKK